MNRSTFPPCDHDDCGPLKCTKYSWREWRDGNLPTADDLTIEWCNAHTGERHSVYNEGGLKRALRCSAFITHWRKIEPPMPLPEPDEI